VQRYISLLWLARTTHIALCANIGGVKKEGKEQQAHRAWLRRCAVVALHAV
jgi:hypothetical protein